MKYESGKLYWGWHLINKNKIIKHPFICLRKKGQENFIFIQGSSTRSGKNYFDNQEIFVPYNVLPAPFPVLFGNAPVNTVFFKSGNDRLTKDTKFFIKKIFYASKKSGINVCTPKESEISSDEVVIFEEIGYFNKENLKYVLIHFNMWIDDDVLYV